MKKNTQKLGNPAVASAVSSYVAQRPEKVEKVVKKGVSIGLVILGVSVLAGGTMVYFKWKKYRFKKMTFDPASQPSNISQAQAYARAQAIYTALKGAATDEEAVYNAFKGVNKNGFIAIYNAFGKREPSTVKGFLGINFFNYEDYMTLIEYIKDDLNEKELKKLQSFAPYLKNFL